MRSVKKLTSSTKSSDWPTPLEIRYKYIVEYPKSWDALKIDFKNE